MKPAITDYPEHYRNYVNLVPEGNIIEILESQLHDTKNLLADIKKEQADFRYAEGKWSVLEVVGHVMDTERIMNYRILRMARGDQTPLAGYDDEKYVEESNFSSRTIADLLAEWTVVRAATVALLKGLPKASWMKTGFANNGEFTVNSIAYIIAGHERHHVGLLKSRYMLG
ncbi:DinB family protein [Bacillus sp. Au-Bac7]|uniref:DinB family protein n=1 Tax=Bacillus sp. Au-Bac7 TaxID=2906458 RepID=UPI001E2D217A|nr:DinB family protein [Bacillus sp. Au-Bac7]MCE4049643.1 DinB family protein [Bacillus sp. Au-Bac7]